MLRALALASILTALVLAPLAVPDARAQPAAESLVPVATYQNDPAHETQATRMRASLEMRNIVPATTCSTGCTVSVPASRYAESMRIVRDVIAREHLDIAPLEPATS